MEFYKTELQKLKVKYPNLDYYDSNFYPDKNSYERIDVDADALILDHYNDLEITVSHSSGNPELEYDKKVLGSEYIEYTFHGSKLSAFKNA